MIAKGTRHTAGVHRLIRAIQAGLAAAPQECLQLRVEAPLDLGPAHEPVPDLALVAGRDDDYRHAHPTAAETALVIEVADSNPMFDLEAKARPYAAAGIPHDWVVDVQAPRLYVVHTAPGSVPGWLGRLRESVEQNLAALPQG